MNLTLDLLNECGIEVIKSTNESEVPLTIKYRGKEFDLYDANENDFGLLWWRLEIHMGDICECEYASSGDEVDCIRAANLVRSDYSTFYPLPQYGVCVCYINIPLIGESPKDYILHELDMFVEACNEFAKENYDTGSGPYRFEYECIQKEPNKEFYEEIAIAEAMKMIGSYQQLRARYNELGIITINDALKRIPGVTVLQECPLCFSYCGVEYEISRLDEKQDLYIISCVYYKNSQAELEEIAEYIAAMHADPVESNAVLQYSINPHTDNDTASFVIYEELTFYFSEHLKNKARYIDLNVLRQMMNKRNSFESVLNEIKYLT